MSIRVGSRFDPDSHHDRGSPSFDVLERPPDDQKLALARRVYTGAYDRAASNREGEGGEGKAAAVEPAKAKAEKAPRSRQPH